MQTHNIHKHADWFASYMNAIDGGNDAQGEALVKCQIKKIQQLMGIIETIKGEIELADTPQEYNERAVLDSIKALIEQIPEVEHISGSYKWIG